MTNKSLREFKMKLREYLILNKIEFKVTKEVLSVNESLDFIGEPVTKLPDNLSVGGDLDLCGTRITELPDNLSVGGGLYLDVDNIANISYRAGCGDTKRNRVKIFAGCFQGTLDEFCEAVNSKYFDVAAQTYIEQGKACVDELAEMSAKF